MTTVNPTPPLRALRNSQVPRSCHELGVCLHPARACTGRCLLPMPLLAPGVVDGPHLPRPSRGERLSRALMLGACLVAVVVVLVQIAGLL